MVFKGILKQKHLFAMLSGSRCVRSVYFAGQFRQVGGCLSVIAGGGGQRAIAVSVAAAGPGRRQGWGGGGCQVTWCLEVVGGGSGKSPTLSRGRYGILHPRPIRQFTALSTPHCVRPQGSRRFEDWKYTGGDLRAAVEGVAEKMAAGSWKPAAEIFQSGSVSKETGAHNWAQIVPRR